MKILVINAGSSSLKYQLIKMNKEKWIAKGNCERIGQEDGIFSHKTFDDRKLNKKVEMKNHTDAFQMVTAALTDSQAGVIKSLKEVSAIGHRVAQGGSIFHKSVRVTEKVLKDIESLIPLAPLHNGPELDGIRACQEVFGTEIPQCVVFDTSFHATMPPKAYMYAIPYEYYEKYKIRRYGFHGTSHRYVSKHCAHLMNQPLEDLKMITCHIGNGSSIAAIRGGKVIDTTMGLTPLDGFMMGTRSGSLDPSIVTFLMEKENLSPSEMNDILNKKSGMYGICGHSDDRDVTLAEADGDPRASLTHEMLTYQIAKYIGSYITALGGLDCLIFTAGLGENQAYLRRDVCAYLKYMGVKIDSKLNETTKGGKEGKISAEDSTVPVWIISTNEELIIARDTKQIVAQYQYASTEDKTVVDLEDI